MDNNLEYWLALSLAGLSLTKVKEALEQIGRPEEIFSASDQTLYQFGFTAQAIQRIRNWKNLSCQDKIRQARSYHLEIITLHDKHYPALLKQIPDPPPVLFVKGKLCSSNELAIAIVGTRHPSLYGLQMAEKFARQLAELGVIIVSGLARGIDTQAHRAALKANGRTIAVLGSGHGNIYPPENRKLAAEISENGALISEFPPDLPPFPENFPRRNRIISGLSRGVLVVEAGQRSGALITATLAAEQNREVFALPGEVTSATSSGTHQLLKEGAKLVESIKDILEELNLQVQKPSRTSQEKQIPEMQEEEKQLLSLLDKDCSLEELAARTGYALPQLSSLLVNLEMKGLVRCLPGKIYRRCQESSE